MKISTITKFTLTSDDVEKAVAQYIQAQGYELEGKEVEFDGNVPQEITVQVTEVKPVSNQEQQPMVSVISEKEVLDYSDLEDTFTPPYTQQNEVVEEKPKRRNPFQKEEPNKLEVSSALPNLSSAGNIQYNSINKAERAQQTAALREKLVW